MSKTSKVMTSSLVWLSAMTRHHGMSKNSKQHYNETNLEREHILLQELVRPCCDGCLHAILRALRTAWGRKLSYALGKSIILTEGFQQPFTGRRCLGCRSLVIAKEKSVKDMCNEEQVTDLKESMSS